MSWKLLNSSIVHSIHQRATKSNLAIIVHYETFQLNYGHTKLLSTFESFTQLFLTIIGKLIENKKEAT